MNLSRFLDLRLFEKLATELRGSTVCIMHIQFIVLMEVRYVFLRFTIIS